MIFRYFLKKFYRLYRIKRYRFSSDIVVDPRCVFGRYTYGEPLLHWYNDGRLIVGSFCSLGAGFTVVGGGEHFIGRVSSYPFSNMASDIYPNAGNFLSDFSRGDIVIGNDVWIGRNVMMLSGVTVGNGAVIGAGAVIAKDVPPYAVVVGNPARVIRFRFDEETIAALQEIQWWNWDDAKINEKMNMLMADSPERLIEECLGAGWRARVHR